ncbi:MAG: hypothetical protein C4539_15780 [Ignavibacteriales bacterium]|nr:MAG: hypothetical protein C4539_15780 [Ignavibacteriales bacterium]
MNQQIKTNPTFSDYIYVIYKWRKFLLINIIVVTAIATLYAFLLPKEYKATATIMIPPDNSMSGLGGLTGLIGGKSSLASLGSKAFGVSSTSEDVILGILNSRSTLTHVIKKYRLMAYYDITDNNMDKALKAFKSDLIADPNEFGMIEFSIINEDPNMSAIIANDLVRMVDSLNIRFNIERAKNNRTFIEQRYLKNINDLRNAENVLFAFQKKYGIVAVPEQLEVTVKAAAEIEANMTQKEMEAYFIKQLYGESSLQYQGIMAELQMLKAKVQELKSSPNLSSSSNILFPFKEMPNIAIEYLRAFREVEIQQAVLEIVMPMYEQAKVEEQKSIPTIMLIDKAVPPQLKYGPKRAAIILGVFALFLFMSIPFVFVAEKAVSRQVYNNPLQAKEANVFKRIIKIYRMKF